MRQASLEIDRTDLGLHVLAGQSWSLIAPSKMGIDPRGVDAPGVIDFKSVPGFLAARQPGIRVWKDFGPEFKLAVSAENPQTAFFGGNTPLVGTPAGGRTARRAEPQPAGWNLTGPGGSFFNNANNVSLNHVPGFHGKGGMGSTSRAQQAHVEGWVLYRDFYDRFNFANHDLSTVSFGGHIAAEIVAKDAGSAVLRVPWLARPIYREPVPGCDAAAGRLDPAFTITALLAGAVWHTTPSLDLYAYAGLERTRATFSNVGTVPFGYGNPLYNNTGCNIENSPAATCNGNTSEIRQYSRRILRHASAGSIRDHQGRRSIFIQPALRFRRGRRRAEDRRSYRHDPAPLLSVLKRGFPPCRTREIPRCRTIT